MELRKLYGYTRKAIDTYQMIQSGDKIAVCISGGKDSLALLYGLAGLRRFYPQPFELVAITVNLGFDNFDLSAISKLCAELNVPYHVVDTTIYQVVFNDRQEKNPCSLCSKMRKGALNEKAVELGCNKIALGHHMEDIVDTMMLSLFFEGRFYVFPPVTYLDRMNLYAIRPLLFVSEKEIIRFTERYQTPVVKSPCPADKKTQRETMKQLLRKIEIGLPGLYKRLFKAIRTSSLKGWQID